MTPYCDGARTEGVASELGRRFRIDPQGMIVALAAEDAEIQKIVIDCIVYSGAYDPAEFTQLMNGLTLPEEVDAAALNILVQMVSRAEENWGMDITNPHTGDHIGLAALLMAVSGLGTALLLKRREMIA